MNKKVLKIDSKAKLWDLAISIKVISQLALQTQKS